MAELFVALVVAALVAWPFNLSTGHNTELDASLDLLPDILANLESELEHRFNTTMDGTLNEELSHLVDQRLDEYLEMVRRSVGLDKKSLSKRSVLEDVSQVLPVPRDPKGVHRLTGIGTAEQYTIPALLSSGSILFQHEGYHYAAALESISSMDSDNLVLYRLMKRKGFVEVDRKTIRRGVDLDAHKINGRMYVVVAEADGDTDGGGSQVFTVKPTGQLSYEQTLSTVAPSDLEFWYIPDRHFLAVASAKYFTPEVSYEYSSAIEKSVTTDVKILEWTDNHFDVVQSISTTGAESISVIQDNSTVFLAIAKYKDEYGNTDIDSEIWQYSLQDKKFVLYSRIRTHAAVNVKFFTMNQQIFLAVANRFESDVEGSPIYETNSIIYKLSEGDFVPFQSFRLEAASHWQTYSGPNGEFVLFVALLWQGLKAYQFNGWRFVEVPLQNLSPVLRSDILSLQAVSLNQDALLAVSSKMSTFPNGFNNVFKLEFSHENPLEKHRGDLIHWCRRSLDTLATDDLNKVVQEMQQAPKWDSPVVAVNGDLEFQGSSSINMLDTGAVKSDKVSMDSIYLQNLNELQALLNRQIADLDDAVLKSNMAVRKDGTNLPGGRLVTKELYAACGTDSCFLAETHADKLNGEPLESFLEKVVSLDDDLLTKDPLRFSLVTVRGNLQTNKIAGSPATSLVNRITTGSLHRPLVVTGQLSAPNLTAGVLDGVVFSEDELLLLQGDQKLKYPLKGSDATIQNLSVSGKINGLALNVQVNPEPASPTWTGPQMLPSLNIGTLVLDGTLGEERVLVSGLVANTLRTDKPFQELNVDCNFESVSTYDVDVGALSGVKIEDLVDISSPTVVLPGRTSFATPIRTSSLDITERLGAIPVKDGQLQVLSTQGTTQTNIVTGTKTIQRLVMTDSANIKGTILGLDLNAQKRPPVLEIDKPIDINADVTISATLNVAVLDVSDFADASGSVSLTKVLQRGLRLDDPELPPNVQFEGTLNVGNLVVEQVNEIDSSYWVPKTQREVILTASKTFNQGLSISGSSSINGLISGVNLADLDAQAVKITGLQVITGHKIIESVSVHSASSNNTKLGVVNWRDVLLKSGYQYIPGTSHVDGTMIVKGGIAVTNIGVTGSISGLTLKNLLEDTVFNDERTYVVTGPKKFLKGFEIGSLVMDSQADSNTRVLPPTISPVQDVVEVTKDLFLRQAISVLKLGYHGKLDTVEDDAWNKWLLTFGDQSILGAQVIEGYITAEAGITLGNGYINQVNMTRLLSDAVRTDKPAHLGAVDFDGGVRSYGPIKLQGTLGGTNISNALSYLPTPGHLEQVVLGSWTIDSLDVKGAFLPGGLFEGEDLRALCAFASNGNPAAPTDTLHVIGSVTAEEEPYISAVNSKLLSDIFDQTWLRNMDAEILAPVELKGVAHMKSRVNSHSTIDGVNIKRIAESYFSLTKEASILTEINFKGGVTAPKARLGELHVTGPVNGQLLTTFASNVLRDGGFQEILALVSFDTFHTSSNLSVLGLVNGLNLSSDVMRIDQANVITRPLKIIGSVHTVELNMRPTVALHGVDLEMWSKKAVRTTGNYTVYGKTILKETRMAGGVRVNKLVNGVPFDADHLLLVTGEQTITGRKTFNLRSSRSPLVVQHLELKGLLNGVQIGEYLRRSAKKNGDVTFLGPVLFSSPLRAHAAQIANMYHGVDFSQLVMRAGAPVELEEFRSANEQLLRTASRAVLSLKSHAFYLNDFGLSHTFSDTKCIFPLSLFRDPVAQLAVVYGSNGYNVISRFVYDDTLDMIYSIGQRNETIPSSVYLMMPILWKGFYNAFYWEMDKSGIPGYAAYVGHIMALTHEGSLSSGEVVRSASKADWVSSVNLGERSCLIRGAYSDGSRLELFCSDTGISYEPVQVLDVPSPRQAAHVSVGGVDHVFITCSSDAYTEGTVSVWRWDDNLQQLTLSQTYPVLNATAVDAITYSGVHFVAVASGRLDMKPHRGMVDISRYDATLDAFAHWLSLEVEAPLEVKFAILPTDELLLYVLTEQPTRSFVAFLYRGLAGFQEHTSAAVPLGETLNAMQTVGYNHLVSVSSVHGGKAVLLHANYKGVKYVGSTSAAQSTRRRRKAGST